jgi:hypothetical protein
MTGLGGANGATAWGLAFQLGYMGLENLPQLQLQRAA